MILNASKKGYVEIATNCFVSYNVVYGFSTFFNCRPCFEKYRGSMDMTDIIFADMTSPNIIYYLKHAMPYKNKQTFSCDMHKVYRTLGTTYLSRRTTRGLMQGERSSTWIVHRPDRTFVWRTSACLSSAELMICRIHCNLYGMGAESCSAGVDCESMHDLHVTRWWLRWQRPTLYSDRQF